MHGWSRYECTLCCAQLNKTDKESRGKIEIGRNEDGKQENVEVCPLCMGSGWLNIQKSFLGIYHSRLYTEDYDID